MALIIRTTFLSWEGPKIIPDIIYPFIILFGPLSFGTFLRFDSCLCRHKALAYRAPERSAYPVVLIARLAGSYPVVCELKLLAHSVAVVALDDAICLID